MKALLVIVFSLFISAGFGQNSLLTQIKSSTQSSYPRYGVDVNGVYYFVANMATSSDYGFWKSDGTPAGTSRIVTVDGTKPQPNIRTKENIIPFGNKALLIASDYHNNLNFELWITDGTPAGTFLLKDINTPGRASDIKNVKVVSSKGMLKAFFSASNGTLGEELWVTDGTPDGTKLVKDIYQGAWSSSPSDFVQLHDKVLFSALEPTHGRELWITDGTEAGTELVKDIYPGPGNSFVANSKIIVNGSGAYINLNDGSVPNSTVLIQTGGTYNSTHSMGSSFSNVGNLTFFDGKVYFTTNPTAAGNLFYMSTEPMPTGVTNSFTNYSWTAENLTVSNDKLFLLINNSGGQTNLAVIESPVDSEIADLIQVTGANIDPFPTNPEKRKLIPLPNGNIYFFIGQNSSVYQLWFSNGTQQGTKNILNLWLGDYSYVRTFNNKLFFITTDIEGKHQCYVSDNGSDAALVKDLTPDLNIDNVYPLVQSGDWFYFSAYNPATGYELYKSNGAANTFIKDIDATYKSNDNNFSKTVANSKGLFFAADDGKNGLELWKTNGKQAGTGLFSDLNPYPMPETTMAEENAFEYYNNSSKFWDLYEFNDQIYIMTFKGIWVTNGVNPPIQLYAGPRLGQVGFSNKFEAANGLVYFNVVNELWQTAGSPESTTKVGVVDNTRPNDSYYIRGLRAVNNKLYFIGYSTMYGDEVYKYDGVNISLVKDVIPGQNMYMYNSETEVVGNSFYYTKFSSTEGCQLYITDGTEANTKLLHSFGTAGACPSYLTNFKDSLLVFSAYDSENGTELWQSNGTVAGTKLVKDIYPGTGSSSPLNSANKLKYVVFEDDVYFLASTPAGSRKLFKSDLTPEGTISLTDIGNIYAYIARGGVYFADGGLDSEPAKIESTPASKRVLANIVPNGQSLPQYFVGHNGLIFMRIALPNGTHQIHVFKDCKNNAVLAGDINYLYDQAYDTIKSSNRIAADKSYKLIAGKSIELTPGFVADSNSIFEARIEACVYSTTDN